MSDTANSPTPVSRTARPLDGIRVLDFTSMVSGPWCTRLLADLGADVVKVEAPGGDLIRFTPPDAGGGSRYFAAFNCGKRSLVLDLKNEGALAITRRLVARTDVLVENFRPGVMASYGLDAATLRSARPELVYCSISGFGQQGPRSHWPAYAPIVHALSGLDAVFMAAQPDPNLPPVTTIQVADVLTGTYAFGAIQTALFRRLRTGDGDTIDSSLIDSAISVVAGNLQAAQVPSEQRSIPTYRAVRAADGYVMPVIIADRAFASLAREVAPQWLTDSELATAAGRSGRMPEIYAAIERWAATRTARECQDTLMRANVPCATYATPEDLLADEHLRARGSFAAIEDAAGSFLVNNAPFQFASAAIATQRRAPGLGEHSQQVLHDWLALDASELERLRRAGALGS